MSPTPVGARAPRVSAVIVSHDGERWIPHLISSLEAATCTPDEVVAVDTGSGDGSAALLEGAIGSGRVIHAPRDSGFGDAVRRGVAALSPDRADSDDEWLWLLHDDCAPAPDALEQLLLLVREFPDAAVVGCRVRAWPRARGLLEVGVTTTGTGRRETGLEPGEYDQGQHDGVRRVLAVSSAGMLVRRRVWDDLGGFDRRLPLFRDDVDFGWRAARAGKTVVVSPNAVVFHAEAATRGVRPIANTLTSPHRADRAAALYTLLVNCSLAVLPLQYLRLGVGSVLRCIGFMVGKLPSAALDELAAAARVLSRPDRIVAGRAARRSTRTASRSQVRRLLPGWWTPYANGVDALLSRFAESFRESAAAVADSAARTLRGRGSDLGGIESGPVDDDAVDLAWGAGPVAWIVRHPVVSLSGALAALALIAGRGLYGSGMLQGGALLPAPGGASDWWRVYTEQWHPVALGSSDAASPYVVLLGAAGGALLGKAWLAVDVLMLMAVPLAAWGAFGLARMLFASRAVQAWVALSYGLLPVVSGALGSGRIGTVVAAVLLPWLARTVLPLFAGRAGSPWRPAFGAGLVLAAMTAFCPIAWALASVVAVPGCVLLAVRRRLAGVIALVAALAVPIAVLLPWSFRVMARPSLLLTEAGAVDPSTDALGGDAWQALFGRLAAAGDAPWWIAAGVVVAAIAATLRTDRVAAVGAAWAVAASSLAVAAVVGRQTVAAPGSSVESAAWLGLPVVVAQAGLIVAAALAADGVTTFIQSGRFGWRQPIALLIAVLAIATPVSGLVWWVAAAPHGELARTDDTTLPAYIVDQLQSGEQERVLVLSGDAQHVSYDVVMDDGVHLGDDSVDPLFGTPALDDLVADVVSEGRPADADRLADFGIGFVMVPAPADPALVAAFDGLPGLAKASTDPDQVVGWRLNQPAGLARVYDDPAAHGDGQTLSTSSGSGSVAVAEGPDGRVLDLAAPSDQHLIATLDGAELSSEPTEGGQRYAVGAASGRLDVGPAGHRWRWLALQALAIVVCAVLAGPAARRRQGIAEAPE